MNRADFAALIARDEGCRLRLYADSLGVPTIGYGRNLRDKGISPSEAALLRDHDMDDAEREAAAFPWFASLSERRQLVVLSMLYNLGLPRFVGFRRMIAALQRFDYQTAADEMLDSVWARQVKARADRLAMMMRDG